MAARQLFRAGAHLSLSAQILFEIEDEKLRIRTAIRSGPGEEFKELEGTSFPIHFFHDTQGKLNKPLLEKFCRDLSEVTLAGTTNLALSHDFAFHVIHSAHLLAVEAGIGDAEPKDTFAQLATYHTSMIMARLEGVAGYPEKGQGRHARWTPDSLLLVITEVMRKLKPKHRTYALVAKKLLEVFPERAPKTTAALKKVVARYGLDWNDMKKMADVSAAPVTDSPLIEGPIRTLFERIEPGLSAETYPN